MLSRSENYKQSLTTEIIESFKSNLENKKEKLKNDLSYKEWLQKEGKNWLNDFLLLGNFSNAKINLLECNQKQLASSFKIFSDDDIFCEGKNEATREYSIKIEEFCNQQFESVNNQRKKLKNEIETIENSLRKIETDGGFKDKILKETYGKKYIENLGDINEVAAYLVLLSTDNEIIQSKISQSSIGKSVKEIIKDVKEKVEVENQIKPNNLIQTTEANLLLPQNELEIQITKNELLSAIKDILKLPLNTKINYSMFLGTSLEKVVAGSVDDQNITSKGSWYCSVQTRLNNNLTVNQNRLNSIKTALRTDYGKSS